MNRLPCKQLHMCYAVLCKEKQQKCGVFLYGKRTALGLGADEVGTVQHAYNFINRPSAHIKFSSGNIL